MAKYLICKVGSEYYGVPLLKVSEITGVMPLSPVPATPAYMRGVMSLRGKPVPVVDLGRKRGYPEDTPFTRFACILIMGVEVGKQRRLVGWIVDGVTEYAEIWPDDIKETRKPAPVVGLATVKGKTVVLLDLDEALSNEDAAVLRRIFNG
ncbi:MAG: purine-binding chemotaxis protein CheW [Patescibacteria group bacterium]|nr:purine-binding chemotaxis protein CheW [Patescibacteria group bacterium]